jgi:putative acetyltransferase
LSDDGRYGELKRVFVLESHRGKGYSKAIMEKLEGHLKSSGIALARLETGIRQPEALGLYKRLGYVERAPFGAYVADPLSIFMEKRLDIA